MKLSIKEINLIVQALCGENVRAKDRYFQAGLMIHSKADKTQNAKKAIAYRDEKVEQDEKIKERSALIVKLENFAIECKKNEV